MPHKVSHPLKMSDNGVEVVNLQDALQLLIDKNKLLIEDPAAKERLLRALASERTRQVFGDNGTLRLVQLFQTQQQLRSTGEVDEITADMINKLLKELGAIEVPTEIQFSVRGQVHSADGRVTNRVLVRAFDKDLRSEQLLGETNTDANGQYEITYTSEQFRRADKGTADLRVAALDERGREIVSSGVIFNAQPIETVDLVAGEEVSALSEYERLLQELVPLLEDVPLRELNADDVNFLANDTQIDSTLIRQLSDSARLAQESKDRGEAHAISAEVFYGLLRQNLPSDLSALLSHNRELLRRALLTSIDTSIVPAKLRDELESHSGELSRLTKSRSTRTKKRRRVASDIRRHARAFTGGQTGNVCCTVR
jgi:hypothetical protein